jgi:hypothetical protein
MAGSGKTIQEVLKAAKASDEILNNAELAVQKDGKTALVYLSELGDDEGPARDLLKKQIVPDDKDKKILEAVIKAWRDERAGKGGAAKPTPSETSKKSIKEVLDATDGPNEAQKTAAKKAFTDSKLTNVAQLGDKKSGESGVRAKIKAVLTKASPKLSDAIVTKFESALLAAWEKERPKDEEPAAKQPSETTTVPIGGVDVTAKFPTLRAETAASIETFTIPSIFKAAKAPFVSPSKLRDWQWLYLAKSNNLTTALNLRKLLDPDYADAHAEKPAFLWEKQSGAVIDTAEGSAEARSRVSVSVEEDQAAVHMLADASIAGKYALCEASVKASYKMERQESESLYSKVVQIRARMKQDRCKLVMHNCLRVAPIFQHLIDTALGAETIKPGERIKPEDQFDFLSQLFDKFGHIQAESVYLGAQLEISRDLVSVESESKEKTKTSVNASIKAKYDEAVGGETNIGYATDNSGAKNQSTSFAGYRFRGIGGNPGEIADQQAWMSSANDPELWKIIYREGARPITDWLSQDERNKIEAIIETKKEEAWPNPVVLEVIKKELNMDDDVPNSEILERIKKEEQVFQFPENHALPYFPQDHLVTLKSWSPNYQQSGNRNYLMAENGVTDTPDPRARDEDGKDAKGKDVVPGDPHRVIGKRYPWCQPAPLRAAEGAGDSPAKSHIQWKLVFTGQTTANHEALLWIVTEDEKWALSVFHVPGEVAFACLMPYDYAKKLRTQNSPPRWVLLPVVPPGRLKLPKLPDKNSGYFRIFNPWVSGFLADEYSGAWGRRRYVETVGAVVAGAGGAAGGGAFVPEHDEIREKDGPVFQRTLLRTEVTQTSVFDSATGKLKVAERQGDPSPEQMQQAMYKCQCWLIQDRSHQEKTRPKQFSQLENTYIEKWINDHRAKLRVVRAR